MSDAAACSPIDTDPQPLEWVDGRNRTWRIDADPSGITLQGGGTRFEIPRQAFQTDVYVSPMGDQAVVRLSGPDDEVGFLVSRSDAGELLRRIEALPPSPQQLHERGEQAAATRRPIWPRMTTSSIAALICASLAFIPFIGLLFAAAAVGLLMVVRISNKPGPAWLHMRWMWRVSALLTVWGLGVCLFSSWTWLQPFDFAGPIVEPPPGQYTWTARILMMLVVVISLSVHESAHAVTAWWCGDDYARSLGRVTLNPMAHIDPFGTVLLPLMLTFSGMAPFGYARPVPVRLSGIRRFRRAHILVSIAGPGSNLLLAALALSLLVVAACLLRRYLPGQGLVAFMSPGCIAHFAGFSGASVLTVVISVLKLTFLINVILAAFNLIPVPPLDGSWVLEHLFPNSLGLFYARVRPYGMFLFILLFFSGALRPLMQPAWSVVEWGYYLLWGCLGW